MKKKTKTKAKSWNVTFVCDYCVVTTTVLAGDEEDAEREAATNLRELYGWEMEEIAIETHAQENL